MSNLQIQYSFSKSKRYSPSSKFVVLEGRIRGKLGFIEDCDGVREVCYCEAIDVGDITNTSQMPWAGLVGMSGDEARTIILQDMPSAIVEILPWGTLVSMEYRADRVRIFIDEETGEVKETPRIG